MEEGGQDYRCIWNSQSKNASLNLFCKVAGPPPSDSCLQAGFLMTLCWVCHGLSSGIPLRNQNPCTVWFVCVVPELEYSPGLFPLSDNIFLLVCFFHSPFVTVFQYFRFPHQNDPECRHFMGCRYIHVYMCICTYPLATILKPLTDKWHWLWRPYNVRVGRTGSWYSFECSLSYKTLLNTVSVQVNLLMTTAFPNGIHTLTRPT